MRTELFDYELPESAIAQRPSVERGASRMLEVGAELVDRQAHDFAELVPEGALVVLNDTRVRRARLLGERVPGGGKVEVFLLYPLDAERKRWSALGRANKPLRPGTELLIGDARALVHERLDDGTLVVELCVAASALEVEDWLERQGHVPLPPYVRRPDDASDGERYQTVFARELGSVAAPTAGLHLSKAALTRLEERGVDVQTLTLHVGIGTFRPVSAADLDEHPMHSEHIEVGDALCTRVNQARADKRPVIAVGTTVVRALESAAQSGEMRAFKGETRLLIQPGYGFQVVDGLLTNFHMPKSTLLALVSALVGREKLLAAYREALARGYRFLSYGDAMWIPRRLV
ncbi:MAG: tRNA preQ1(34) S-adenosylmethionine ribosyltransferase-isomerase QueA [Polyangiaceae bacterium]|nr:tRNA preQ1(34) S-adenosylmethionine ribosyltransferase-isomerase QueA [Myxococcales bacterium]MCB9590238.1 tRNA preQ1(34) S-adenosylmethionine ribosyltransferase-isomerase QueA [Polyangiaceae bacterium]MCB9605107.1 tRNA preQ1(34) S-adenosylmethionine ribosyltransferase-isomerase QueA [Polyangiaceae bacterium]